jgi:hypothetical protein
MGKRRDGTRTSPNWLLPMLLLSLLTLSLTSNFALAIPSSTAGPLAADPPVSTTLYFRTSSNSLGGAKTLNPTPGPTNCNVAMSKCINEAFACFNPFMVPCTSGAPKDFVSPALSGPIIVSRVSYTVYIMNSNPLITLSFKIMFNLTKNGATIYSQTSDLFSLKTGASAGFGINTPGNQLLQNVAFAKGDKVDCSVSVLNVQDSSGKPRAATFPSLMYNGKVGSGAESNCTLTTDVCPAFVAGDPITADQLTASCPIPPILSAPEFGSSILLVAAVSLVAVVFMRALLVRNRPAVRTMS